MTPYTNLKIEELRSLLTVEPDNAAAMAELVRRFRAGLL